MLRLAIVLIIFPSLAHAWGETGHRVVCEIALYELSESARREVERLIGLDPDFDSFAESCLFADSPERIREIDHYMNLPRSTTEVTSGDCPMAESCVLRAIRGDYGVLRDRSASDRQKLRALKLLGHWVGDVHQPLHNSFQDDHGANSIDVDTGIDGASLHGVWDYSIVSHYLGDDHVRIARNLYGMISNEQRTTWQHASPFGWANESFQISISPSTGYCTGKAGACWYDEDNRMLDRGEPRRRMHISDEYLERHGPIVAERLQQAGVRLAALIETALP